MENDSVIMTGMDPRQRRKHLMFKPGDPLGDHDRYRFVRPLGAGVMGTVLLFEDTLTQDENKKNILMAVKTVDETLSKDPKAVEDLKTEYYKMFRLTHPGIVAVRNLVEDEFRYYIVMDYADGVTLKDYMREYDGPISLPVALEIVKKLAAALDYAHGEGLVHRDVKPDNMMVKMENGIIKTVKLLDFGLGVQINRILSTMTGEVKKGAAAYRSPEGWNQRKYGKVSARSDQYSLAAVAYEMLAGHYPFYGEFDDEDGLRGLVLDENEYPKKIAGLPDHVNAALRKSFSKRQEDRFENCTAFVEALSALPHAALAATLVALPVEPSPVVSPSPQPVVVVAPSPTRPVVKTPPTIMPSSPKGDLTLVLPGNIPLELIHIHPGTFMMGSPMDEPGRYSDESQHRVTLKKDFWLGKYPVTQAQWQSVMGTTLLDQAKKTYLGEGEKWIGNVGDDYPIYWVNWDEAMVFCRKLTEAERNSGRLPAGYEYTLPSEAQWEYACRAGTTTALYSGGIDILGECNAPSLDGIAWYGGNSSVGYSGTGWDTKDWKEKQYPGGLAGPREIGGKQPNRWGLYDMLGNVWEWCSDWYGAYPNDSVTDPIGSSSGSYRVIRGGSWGNHARRCRSACRDNYELARRSRSLGFRVALASAQ